MSFRKKLIIDARTTVSGKKSNIHLDNPVVLNDWLDYQLQQLGLISSGGGVIADTDWTQDANGVWNNTDFIGIGTDTPDSKFDFEDTFFGHWNNKNQMGGIVDASNTFLFPSPFDAVGFHREIVAGNEGWLAESFVDMSTIIPAAGGVFSPVHRSTIYENANARTSFRSLVSNSIKDQVSSSFSGQALTELREHEISSAVVDYNRFQTGELKLSATDLYLSLTTMSNQVKVGIVESFMKAFMYIEGLENAIDDATAAGLGVPLNGVYRNGNDLKIRIV